VQSASTISITPFDKSVLSNGTFHFIVAPPLDCRPPLGAFSLSSSLPFTPLLIPLNPSQSHTHRLPNTHTLSLSLSQNPSYAPALP